MQEASDHVDRRVVSMQWQGKAARAIVTRRAYSTGIDDLWHAIVDRERLRRWFLPVTGDLREGGRYQLEGNAGGKIIQCVPPSLLAVTWEMHGNVGWLNVKLESLGQRSTRLTLEHVAHEEADFLVFWDQFGPGSMGVGWDLALSGLTEHLAGNTDASVRDEETWMKTADGRDFVRASSVAWVEAAIRFGTEPQVARDAGERTIEFYTGEGG